PTSRSILRSPTRWPTTSSNPTRPTSGPPNCATWPRASSTTPTNLSQATRPEDPSMSRREKIAAALEQPITVDFMKADLDYVMNSLLLLTGVNIIADPAALDGKSITLHVNDLKLREVLDYI